MEDWSDEADSQADLSLRLAFISEGTFFDIEIQMSELRRNVSARHGIKQLSDVIATPINY